MMTSELLLLGCVGRTNDRRGTALLPPSLAPEEQGAKRAVNNKVSPQLRQGPYHMQTAVGILPKPPAASNYCFCSCFYFRALAVIRSRTHSLMVHQRSTTASPSCMVAIPATRAAGRSSATQLPVRMAGCGSPVPVGRK